jgi:DNA-binding IclR family transcriptional regulator
MENLLPEPAAVSPPRSPRSAPGKSVGAAHNALRIVQFAIDQPAPWTATEAARALALNPSTCFNIVRTLVGADFLEAGADSKRYTVGATLVGLAHRLTARARDFSAIRPAMQALADRYKLTVTLWRRHSPTRMELLVVASCNTAVNIQMPVGQRLPLLVGGMGRVMALEGGLSDEERRAAFAQVHWQRPLTYPAFMAQAREAKRAGWGVDDGYMNRSVTAVGVPVRARGAAEVEYVCSATMFRHQYASVTLGDLGKALKPIAASVARILNERD